MKELSCLIIEDLEADAQMLMQMLSELPIVLKIDWSQTASDLLNRLQSETYDFIFLDIRLPMLNGIDLLRETPHLPPVIIVTAYLQYAPDGYDLQVADFLLKPYNRSRLQRAIKRALKGSHIPAIHAFLPPESIFLQASRRMKQFLFRSILFIEARGGDAIVHSSQDATTVSHSISWLEAQLPAKQFIRVQKSFIVNIHHITAADARNLWVGKIRITVGIPYRERLKQILIQLGRSGNGTRNDAD